MRTLLTDPDHRRALRAEADALLEFGRAARVPGGFGWLGDDGLPMPDRPRMLYVTARMTHVYALATMLDLPGAGELVEHGLRSLTSTFWDETYGGWRSAARPERGSGGGADPAKSGYPHAFVLLATSSAALAGVPGARELLTQAEEVYLERFWDADQAMPVEEWDRSFSRCSDYRGANSAMHAVEAMLAVAETTGNLRWLQRAEAVADRLMSIAAEHRWRLPEHYDAEWRPDLDDGRHRPEDPVRPYGSTPGHGLEWSRLLVHLQAVSERAHRAPARDWIADAVALADRAVADGWAVDGADGFVYTVDFDGTPVVRARLHWVLCEALGAATVLYQRTGLERYAQWYAQWWQFALEHQIDHDGGSWHHELGPDLRPAARIRPGKADLYHAVQACLLPGLPLTGSVASAVHAARG